MLNNLLFLFSFHTKSILVVALLSMQGQRALRFHPKDLNLYSEDELRSYGFGTT